MTPGSGENWRRQRIYCLERGEVAGAVLSWRVADLLLGCGEAIRLNTLLMNRCWAWLSAGVFCGDTWDAGRRQGLGAGRRHRSRCGTGVLVRVAGQGCWSCSRTGVLALHNYSHDFLSTNSSSNNPAMFTAIISKANISAVKIRSHYGYNLQSLKSSSNNPANITAIISNIPYPAVITV